MTTPEIEIASSDRRVVASLVDALFLMPINFWLGKSLGLITVPPSGPAPFSKTVLLYIVGFIVYAAINGYLMAKQGQTIGKKLLRVRIVRVSDNTVPPLSVSLGLRYGVQMLAGLVPVIGSWLFFVDALFLLREDKRTIHDLIAGTKVIRVKKATD